MNEQIFIEIEEASVQKNGKMVCGDVFLSRKLKNEKRTIAVLSDGLGSGIKANILATMTANMAMSFTVNDQPVERSARSIINTLPEDSVRKISYASFTIVDIALDGATRIIEYGNPQFFVLRNDEIIVPESVKQEVEELFSYRFDAQMGDRIILFSDGVTQSGIGKQDMPFGWGDKKLKAFTQSYVHNNQDISAYKLSHRILAEALKNDGYTAADDISCAVIYLRRPRKLLISTGPPYTPENDERLATSIKEFQGIKIICGGTTAQIVSKLWKKDIDVDINSACHELPPSASMEGVNLITEGILTLGKLSSFLEAGNADSVPGDNPAKQIYSLLMENDQINILAGTSINPSHQDPNLPEELEIRRNVVKKIARILEVKYLKEVIVNYI